MNKYQTKVDNLRSLLDSYVDSFISNKAQDPLVVDTYEGDYFTIRISKSSTIRQLNQNLTYSYIDFSDCENYIRKRFNLTTSFIYRTIEYFQLLNGIKANVTSSILSFNIFRSDTRELIDTSTCSKESSIKTNYYIYIISPKISLDLYRTYKSSTIDSYNPTSLGFNTRCINYYDPVNGADTSLGYRRTNYFLNLTAQCGSGCVYNGISGNYVQCSCNSNTATYYIFTDSTNLLSIRMVNLDLVTCPHIAFYIVCNIFN